MKIKSVTANSLSPPSKASYYSWNVSSLVGAASLKRNALPEAGHNTTLVDLDVDGIDIPTLEEEGDLTGAQVLQARINLLGSMGRHGTNGLFLQELKGVRDADEDAFINLAKPLGLTAYVSLAERAQPP